MGRDVKILAVIALLVVTGAIAGSYWYRTSVQSERKSVAPAASNATGGQLVREDSWTLGPADAPVTVVEFYDPECESCAAFAPAVKKVYNEYAGKVRLVMRYMPLHKNSMTAATFLEAAGEQGKYWQAQELLFRKQPEWGEKHGAAPDPNAPKINQLFDKYAMELGLDLERASKAIQDRRFIPKIDLDKKDGQGLGVKRTPTFYVNGRELARLGEADLRALIEEELKN